MTRHGIAAIPIFFGLPAAALACAWRFHRAGHPRWAFYSAATAASTVVNLGLAGAGFSQAPRLANRAGLFQRASIVTAFAWITAVSARAISISTPSRPIPAAITRTRRQSSHVRLARMAGHRLHSTPRSARASAFAAGSAQLLPD